MATGQRVDPYRNFNFLVEIDGITQAGFSDASGFGASTDPIEYREGGETKAVRKLPGITKWNNITLKWGLTDSRELFDWYQDIVNGKIERKNGSIIVLDLEGNETVRWNFYEAWPTKWDGPDYTAKGNDVAIETLELATERVERA
ncbi:MAG: phage tail protein [Ardenticatenaceae bacterium]|nr:phage tail protein [Ardenticatenaceae bacterium]HBY93087.1 phage tail protein [Chloroflexota bacterium]